MRRWLFVATLATTLAVIDGCATHVQTCEEKSQEMLAEARNSHRVADGPLTKPQCVYDRNQCQCTWPLHSLWAPK